MGGRFKDALPLKVFVRKKQVLDLYRRLLRAGRRADVALSNGESTDLYDRVRTEFRIHRNMIDSGTISTLITEGMYASNAASLLGTLALTSSFFLFFLYLALYRGPQACVMRRI